MKCASSQADLCENAQSATFRPSSASFGNNQYASVRALAQRQNERKNKSKWNSLNDDDRKLASRYFRSYASISIECSSSQRKFDCDHMTHAVVHLFACSPMHMQTKFRRVFTHFHNTSWILFDKNSHMGKLKSFPSFCSHFNYFAIDPGDCNVFICFIKFSFSLKTYVKRTLVVRSAPTLFSHCCRITSDQMHWIVTKNPLFTRNKIAALLSHSLFTKG